jgi:tRNA dimethylallyltransferase
MATENTPCCSAPARQVNKGAAIPVAVLLGATATGKSALALDTARQAGWDIISCDSRQIYRGMDIGTAKPSPEDREQVRHWLVDILDPSQEYSASRFAAEAAAIIRERAAEGGRVIVCGGTGLYFRALSEGLSDLEASDPQARQQLMAEAAEEGGGEKLYRELTLVDPETARRLHTNDIQRIVRALAVYRQTGNPMSLRTNQRNPPVDLHFIVAKLDLPRDLLYDRINRRVDRMMEAGLLREFEQLVGMGYGAGDPGMQSVGYRELFDVLSGICTRDAAAELIKRNTRRYAKRQTTWFSHQVEGVQFDATVQPKALLDFYRNSGLDA